ncbi:MAG: glycosyltransferase family 8 protein [Bacteroidales bacterium]|nr:glycosyltransferase family 8 protein [Bacteroidales bacterium]
MAVPLVIAFTPNYFVPAATTLKSLLDSSSADDRYEVICLVSEEIPQRQKDKLSALSGERIIFRYINLAGRLQGVYVDPRYSEAASFRLLLPEILPEYDKVLYIDCDVIIRNNLAALYRDTDLGDNLLAAVYEAPIEQQGKRWAALGCDPHRYFNSGFLMMNLRQMRLEGTSRKLIDGLKSDYLEFPDQDVLNQVCQDRVLALKPIYNSIRTFFLPQYKPDFLKQYSEADWGEVQKHGTIHYTGGKPWNILSVKFGEWWKTYRSLPAEIKAEWKPSGKIRILASIYRTKLGATAMEAARSLIRKIK